LEGEQAKEDEQRWQRDLQLQQEQQQRDLQQLAQEQRQRQQSRNQDRPKRLKVEGTGTGCTSASETSNGAVPSNFRGYHVEPILEPEAVDKTLHARFRLLWPGLEAAGWKVVAGRGLENCKDVVFFLFEKF
jgi:hypothetical protein